MGGTNQSLAWLASFFKLTHYPYLGAGRADRALTDGQNGTIPK
jgi:hypothetical protein